MCVCFINQARSLMYLQPIACLISAAPFALLARHPWSFQGPTVQEKNCVKPKGHWSNMVKLVVEKSLELIKLTHWKWCFWMLLAPPKPFAPLRSLLAWHQTHEVSQPELKEGKTYYPLVTLVHEHRPCQIGVGRLVSIKTIGYFHFQGLC